jgi:hypothetical protein
MVPSHNPSAGGDAKGSYFQGKVGGGGASTMAKRKNRSEPVVSAETLEKFGPRLGAIGPYQMAVADDGVDVEWERPTGLPDVGFRVEVEFIVETDAGNLEPDERMFALWDRFLAGMERHAAFFRRAMIAVYRENEADLVQYDGFAPNLPDEEVLKMIRGIVIVKRLEEDGQVDHWLDVSFAAHWDGEHAWDFEYDESADSFGEPSKG